MRPSILHVVPSGAPNPLLLGTVRDVNADFAIGAWGSEKSDLWQACEDRGIPAGPINDLAEVFDDPQIAARGMQVELDGVPGVRAPFTFSDAELKLDRPSPKLGEDN